MSTSHAQTLAYQPAEFFQLGAEIASWCHDEDIYASFPEIHTNEGRIYFFTQFGYSPHDSGCLGVFAWDDPNQEFCYWETENDSWDHDKSTWHNVDHMESLCFDDLMSLKQYVKHGDL